MERIETSTKGLPLTVVFPFLHVWLLWELKRKAFGFILFDLKINNHYYRLYFSCNTNMRQGHKYHRYSVLALPSSVRPWSKFLNPVGLSSLVCKMGIKLLLALVVVINSDRFKGPFWGFNKKNQSSTSNCAKKLSFQ